MSAKNKLNEYIYLAYLTEPREVGESTKRSPQHLTLVPPFPFDKPVSELREAVHQVAKDTKAFDIKIGQEAKFGSNQHIDVRLIEPPDVVRMLHYQLMHGLADIGVSTPLKYVYEAFVPHITIKPNHTTKLEPGELMSLDHIAIMHKDKGYRTLLAKEDLVSA